MSKTIRTATGCLPSRQDKPLWDGSVEAGDTRHIVPRGYVHIIADERGTGKVRRVWMPTPVPAGWEGTDTTWWNGQPQQPWCDGNVGMTGYSAYAAAQFMTAVEQPPHLRAIYFSGIAPDSYRGYSLLRRSPLFILAGAGKNCGHQRFLLPGVHSLDYEEPYPKKNSSEGCRKP